MAYAGKWTFVKSENMKEFVLAAGGPPDKAEAAAALATSLECGKDGDTFFIKITGGKGEVVHRFKPGEPFKEVFQPLGKERQAVASMEGDTKLIIKGVEEGSVVETREVKGDEMVLSLTKPGVSVVGKRFFKRA